MIRYYVLGKLKDRFIHINYFTSEKMAKDLEERAKLLFSETKILAIPITNALNELCLICLVSDWTPFYTTIPYILDDEGNKVYDFKCAQCQMSLKTIVVKKKSIESFIGG